MESVLADRLQFAFTVMFHYLFPIGTMGPALRQIDEAKRICRACPAQAACLAWAIEHGITSGVWGGTSEDERRVLRRPAGRK